MITRTAIALAALLFLLVIPTRSEGQVSIACQPGASPVWGSGWCDFATPVAFKKGETLRLAIGGTASRIIVRLLPKGADAPTPIGIIPSPYAVPSSRFVEVIVPHDVQNVGQISVHGGPNPWNLYPLGAGNGPATISGVERLGNESRQKP